MSSVGGKSLVRLLGQSADGRSTNSLISCRTDGSLDAIVAAVFSLAR